MLGIESTCDETGFALVRGRELLIDVTASSMDEHSRFGGIVPEVASRAHLEAFVPTLREALTRAGLTLEDVDAVAVASGPGLVGSLTVGTAGAKALALVVSGGHSSLLLVNDIASDVVELGQTLDDAAGEAFDKVGRLLGLPYPGGPHVDRLAREGNPEAIAFPRGLTEGRAAARHPYDFSFSGLKTAVARYLEAHEDSGEPYSKADVAASFSEAVADVLVTKTLRAARIHDVGTVVIGGGFSANSRLRELAAQRFAEAGIELRIPPIRYCTDNGAMIAALGSALLRAGVAPSPLDLAVDSQMPLSLTSVVPR